MLHDCHSPSDTQAGVVVAPDAGAAAGGRAESPRGDAAAGDATRDRCHARDAGISASRRLALTRQDGRGYSTAHAQRPDEASEDRAPFSTHSNADPNPAVAFELEPRNLCVEGRVICSARSDSRLPCGQSAT